MIFGYARISTHKDIQTTQRQLLTLNNYAGANNFTFDSIIEERASGTINTDCREEYKKLKDRLRAQDILIITDLDRLGRNADNVIMELKELKSKGIRVIALDMPYMNQWETVNTNDSLYNMVIDIVITIKAHMAQQEREKTVQRINQGLAVARAKGKKLGRPAAQVPRDFIREYSKYKNKEYGCITASAFAKMLGIGRSTMYKYIRLLEGSK